MVTQLGHRRASGARHGGVRELWKAGEAARRTRPPRKEEQYLGNYVDWLRLLPLRDVVLHRAGTQADAAPMSAQGSPSATRASTSRSHAASSRTRAVLVDGRPVPGQQRPRRLGGEHHTARGRMRTSGPGQRHTGPGRVPLPARGLTVPADHAPDQSTAPKRTAVAGYTHLNLDGTVVRTDRVSAAGSPPRERPARHPHPVKKAQERRTHRRATDVQHRPPLHPRSRGTRQRPAQGDPSTRA